MKAKQWTLQEHNGKNYTSAFEKTQCKYKHETIADELFAKKQNFKGILIQYCYLKRTVWNEMCY